MALLSDSSELNRFVGEVVHRTPVTDMHTHLYPPVFGDLLLWGPDDLLTYHYLVAETMRQSPLSYQAFWSLPKRERADAIWRTLFLDHTPLSEASRGILTTFQRLGLNVASRDLEAYRRWYAARTSDQVVDLVLATAHVRDVVMTNDPLDAKERSVWLRNPDAALQDHRFHAALRLDPLLNDWPNTAVQLRALGYNATASFHAGDEHTAAEITRFLVEWARRMEAVYLAVSLPGEFAYPADDARTALLDGCVLPACQSLNVPLALMIGVKRQANPQLRLAGDRLARADLDAVEALCLRHPENRFLVTMLSRENQHELAVLARKFRNVMVFGCWWFLNTPSLVREITTLRVELLGTGFIPQHSDARVLDQLIYKWTHARETIATVLCEKYQNVLATGWRLETEEIERDIADLLGNNFWRFVKGPG